MKKIFTSAVILGTSLLLSNCKPDDNTTTVQDRDRQEVYVENLNDIENFLKKNSIEILDHGVKFDSVTNEASNSIWKQTAYPLQSITLKNNTYTLSKQTNKYERIKDDVEYKVYYIILAEGGGSKPYLHDDVYTAYQGYNLDRSSFDNLTNGFWSSYPDNTGAVATISGYQQILQQIKTAAGIIDNGDGTYTYDNPGRVVVFIPSGLAYFSANQVGISAYEPIIFDIKLITNKEADHDKDGILDKYEDLNNNGNLWDDDTDNDGKPNFLDIDDDGDGYTTREEITYLVEENGETIKKLYLFEEIPNCANGSIKKHLDKTCH